MEQHFGILKSIYLQGKRITRLDKFIELYRSKRRFQLRCVTWQQTNCVSHNEIIT